MKSISLALALWAACTAPVLADTPGNNNPHQAGAPSVGTPSVADQPHLVVLPVPIPWLMVGALVNYTHFRLGPSLDDLKLAGGYYWSNDYVYDPISGPAVPAAGASPFKVPSNRWKAIGEWDVHLGGGWTLGPTARLLVGGLTAAGQYDPSLAGGYSVMAGPLLHYDRLNEKAFPTHGTALDLSYDLGQHNGDESLTFQKGGLNAVYYHPLARNQTLAMRATVQAGFPRLSWLDKFSVGGGDFVRGYQWNRFTGDRLAAVGLEYRALFLEDLTPVLHLPKLPITPGLAATLHVDAGRAWEGRDALPFGNDIRAGGGVGLIMTLDRAPFGRVELNGSAEGLYPVAELGTSF